MDTITGVSCYEPIVIISKIKHVYIRFENQKWCQLETECSITNGGAHSARLCYYEFSQRQHTKIRPVKISKIKYLLVEVWLHLYLGKKPMTNTLDTLVMVPYLQLQVFYALQISLRGLADTFNCCPDEPSQKSGNLKIKNNAKAIKV